MPLSQSCNQSCEGLVKNIKRNAFNKKCEIEEDSGASFTPPDGQGSNNGNGSTAPFDPTTATFVNRTTDDGLGDNSHRGLYVDGLGNIYAGTHGGLSISTNGGTSFVNKTTADGLGDEYTYEAYADDSGNIYAATGYGLAISTDGGTSFINKTYVAGLGVILFMAFTVMALEVSMRRPAEVSLFQLMEE